MNQFFFKKSDVNDISLIQSLLEQAPTYSLNVEGYLPATEAGLNTISALPPSKNFSPERKYVHIIYWNEKPIGITDCLDGYPEANILFIGLFLLTEDNQKKGIGKAAYQEYEKMLIASFPCKKIRLAVVESNPVLGFWQKQGFVLTGEKKKYEAGLVKSFSLMLEKNIN